MFPCSRFHLLVTLVVTVTALLHMWLALGWSHVACCLLAQFRGQSLFISQGTSVLMRFGDRAGLLYPHCLSSHPSTTKFSSRCYYCGLGMILWAEWYRKIISSLRHVISPLSCSLSPALFLCFSLSLSLSLSLLFSLSLLPLSFPTASLFSLSISFKVLYHLHGTLPKGRAALKSSSSTLLLSLNQLSSEHLVTRKFSILWSRLGWAIWSIGPFSFSSYTSVSEAICLAVWCTECREIVPAGVSVTSVLLTDQREVQSIDGMMKVVGFPCSWRTHHN